jgi:hypothetical protein
VKKSVDRAPSDVIIRVVAYENVSQQDRQLTMNVLKCFFASIILLMLSIIQIPAQVLYSDGFETYNNGALDANLNAGPNQAPNGGPGNPWFGPGPPNLHVVGPGGGLSSGAAGPHSGVKMVTGAAASDFDQDWLNIAHRFNGGNAYMGSISLDWWFYDPTGAGNVNYRDYVALGNYSVAATAATSGLDYTAASGGSLNGGSVFQRLSLGGSNPTGFNANNYQARVVGATDGTASGQWFNVGTRSVGWHEGTIVLGVPNGASTTVSFFIDGVDVLNHAITTANGVNVIELNAGFGTTGANYDDFTLSAVTVPEPSTVALFLCGGLSCLALRRRK